MKLEVITPEKKMFEGEVEAVRFPGVDGSFQVLKGHAPIISSLSEGKIKVDLINNDQDYKDASGLMKIAGGVMEMQNDKIVVLAD